jgi:hypothetical protein
MRYGDAKHRAELARQRDDLSIRNVSDVTTERLRAERAFEVRIQVKNRGRLRRKELTKLLKEEGVTSVTSCPLISETMRRRLTVNGDMSVYRGCSLTELVRYARDSRKWTDIHDLSKSFQ